MEKRISCICFIMFLASLLFCQEITISISTASSSSVLGGKAVCSPQKTSYGFVLITDAKYLTAINEDGKVIWEKRLTGILQPELSVLDGEFLAVSHGSGSSKDAGGIPGRNRLTIFNPDGEILCETEYPESYTITKNVFSGRDGRIFVQGVFSDYQNSSNSDSAYNHTTEKELKNFIDCYSIFGLKKWHYEFYGNNCLKAEELPDGTLLVITDGNKGLRLSPFGSPLESISFSGKIKSAERCRNGILITFYDGKGGLVSLEKGLATDRWTVSSRMYGFSDSAETFGKTDAGKNKFEDSSKGKYSGLTSFSQKEDNSSNFKTDSSSESEKILYYTRQNDNLCFFYLSKENGESNESFLAKIPSFGKNADSDSQFELKALKDGIFIKNGMEFYFYGHTGKLLSWGKFPSDKNSTILYAITDNRNNLYLFYKNWNFQRYSLYQSAGAKQQKIPSLSSKIKKYDSKSQLNYDEITAKTASRKKDNLSIYTIAEETPEIITEMKKGNYAEKEAVWIQFLCQSFDEYMTALSSSDFGIHVEKPYFIQNPAAAEALVLLMPELQLKTFSSCISTLLKKETNKSILKAALEGINGYDPNLKLMESLAVLASKTSADDETIHLLICRAVQKICIVTGKNAFNTYGNDILRQYFSPQYGTRIKQYARETYQKIR